MNITFEGKRALVTGAGRGIGKETAKRLHALGAKVIAISRTQANLDSLAAELPGIETHCVDIGNWDETTKVVEAVGPIDLLVNNAAYACLTPIIGARATEANCDNHFDVNVKAIINITQIVAQGMIDRKSGGAIVNMSSQAGLAALADHLVYSAAKGAVDAITRVLALEYGPYGIRTNSVNPTVTWTDMAKVGWSDPKVASDMISKIPLGRFAQPSEVVDAIMYLLSDRSSMINGITLPIDGGFVAC